MTTQYESRAEFDNSSPGWRDWAFGIILTASLFAALIVIGYIL